MKMKAALYARVSTPEQDPDNQVSKLREFAAAGGHQIVAEYVDVESGRRSGRRRFQAMLHDARRRRFEVLLFFSFSRLTREGPQRTAWYLHELDQAGVSYLSISERDWLDSTGRWAFVVTMMMATIAAMEVEQLSARTKAGMDRARRKGEAIGRPSAFVDRQLLDLCQERNLSLAEIARRAGVSERTIRRRIIPSASPEASAT